MDHKYLIVFLNCNIILYFHILYVTSIEWSNDEDGDYAEHGTRTAETKIPYKTVIEKPLKYIKIIRPTNMWQDDVKL